MKSLEKISVTMLTRDSERYLHEVLAALSGFDEVVVLDNGSRDQTMEIARSYENVRVVEHPFIGFGPLKNLAAAQAVNDWILSIDSDELLLPQLEAEIARLPLGENTKTIYAIPRINCYNKKPIDCCGWGGDLVKRLYNKKVTRFNDNQVHESIIEKGLQVKQVSHNLVHYSFADASELIDKMQRYSTLYAKDYQGKKRTTPLMAFLRATFAFCKYYFLQRGFLSGYEGLVIAVSNANGVFYKYIKLYEQNKQ